MVGQIFTFIINIKYKMASRFASRLQKESSQFRIDQISRKKKGGLQNKNHRYSIISYQKRVQLINLASSKGYSISRAARELGIKPSTGKFIVKCFRDNGKIMKKTQNQQLKSGNNCQEYSATETGDHKSDMGQKNNINLKQSISASDNNFKNDSENIMPNQNGAQMYLFGYQYEQPVINHMIFYPSFQNLGGMVMPLYFSQSVQY